MISNDRHSKSSLKWKVTLNQNVKFLFVELQTNPRKFLEIWNCIRSFTKQTFLPVQRLLPVIPVQYRCMIPNSSLSFKWSHHFWFHPFKCQCDLNAAKFLNPGDRYINGVWTLRQKLVYLHTNEKVTEKNTEISQTESEPALRGRSWWRKYVFRPSNDWDITVNP